VEFSNLELSKKTKNEWNKIGEGGQSDVYLTSYLGIKVAVKTFKSPIENNIEFKKEIKVLE
jgi:predicted Ser/Thr protein kinase